MTDPSTSGFPIFGESPGSVDTPEWVADAVFYQIFPDRFAISDTLEKPSGIEPWDSEPTTYGYKGGDLLGVVEKLDYLQELGITALYFNPIFQSASNHRYHTHDYMKVDPLLGGDEAFETMLAASKERGIRVVLDGVFNHASRGFFQFNDVLENGAASPWIDWFIFGDSFPVNAYDHNKPAGYTAWWGLHALPKLNTDNPQVREYLMQVGEHWIRKGIDGWRLDVADEITTEGFWQEFRDRVKAINPEAWIVAEIWEVEPQYLQGDMYDALMNYPFTSAALAFCGRERVVKKYADERAYDPYPGIDGVTYAEKIDDLLEVYDWNVTLNQLNLLDSHDTARAITLLGGDMRSLELATLLLFTYPGAPSIYYGDEIGIDGGLPDQWARKTFPWQDESLWNTDLLDHFRRLVELRLHYPALRRGLYQGVAASEGSYCFRRELDGQELLVAINTSEEADKLVCADNGTADAILSIGEPAEIESAMDGTTITLPPRSATVWSLERE
jgi:cyclomaltodextrinase / maltogenic alpha-amylase / neopullulanase